MICPKCGRLNNEENTYCEFCRAKMVKEFINCPHCGTSNNKENIFCKGCGTRLAALPAAQDQANPPIMYCYKCGTQNEDADTFCTACGFALIRFAQTPPSPTAQTAATSSPGAAHQRSKPKAPSYITEYVLGLIGAMTGTIAFLILIIAGIYEMLSYYSFAYANGIYILVSALLVLASFILGFIGISPLKRSSAIGGIHLIIGGALSIAAIVIAPGFGWITALSFPLLVAGGIIALARRKTVEQGAVQN